jgi:2-polyprenyl-6-methoxyphenol hydroxylase-like FAD-dependent oxidoreductase
VTAPPGAIGRTGERAASSGAEAVECDVLVIGGRVAGSILATALAAEGRDVVVVDRARFPSPTVSTHFFRGARGVTALREVGVLDEALALGPPKLTCQYDYVGTADPEINPPQNAGELGFCLSVRREPLDDILLRRAEREPTVRVLQQTRLVELAWSGGRVAGAMLERAEERLEVHALFTVGADGRHSTVARQVSPAFEHSDTPTRALFYRYVRDFQSPGPDPGPEFSFQGDEIAYVFPSDDGVTCVAASINLNTFRAIRHSLNASFEDVIARHPGIADRYQRATPISKVLGCGPEACYVRRPFGDGWALVGDASIHQDPWTGLGIDFASTHALWLAEALSAALRNRKSETTALRTYWKRRNEQDIAAYRQTTELAKDLSKAGGD